MTAPPGPRRRPLPRSFYDRPAPIVARELLGAELTHEVDGTVRRARLVETEAYVRGDAASHSFHGPTERNRSMFHRPGTLYVFRIHQVSCANAVTREGEAVLFRAAEPMEGVVGSTSGPGRLCRALGLAIGHDGLDLVQGPVQIRAGATRPPPVVVGPRVGIRQAVDLPLRFAIVGDRWVSSPRPSGWSPRPR